MTLFRSLFLAGLVLFFAVQQALCACTVPQAAEHHVMDMAMDMAMPMPSGHACDEIPAPGHDKPGHDKADCPHCGSDAQFIAKAAQTAPAPILLAAPVLIRPLELAGEARARAAPLRPARYQAHGPPKRTPLQLKTRFLN